MYLLAMIEANFVIRPRSLIGIERTLPKRPDAGSTPVEGSNITITNKRG